MKHITDILMKPNIGILIETLFVILIKALSVILMEPIVDFSNETYHCCLVTLIVMFSLLKPLLFLTESRFCLRHGQGLEFFLKAIGKGLRTQDTFMGFVLWVWTFLFHKSILVVILCNWCNHYILFGRIYDVFY